MSYSRLLTAVTVALVLWAASTATAATLYPVAPSSDARASTTTGMICAPSALTLGSPEEVSCLVTVGSATLPIPTGEVFFTATGGAINESCVLAPEDGGHATCGVTYRPNQVGAQTLTDRYAGDESHQGSEGSIQIGVLEPSRPGAGSNGSSSLSSDAHLRKHPSKVTTDRLAKFAFGSGSKASSFECELDGKTFKPCSSPVVKKVVVGRHRFQVRAVNAEGQADPTPVVFRWRVVRSR